MKTASEQRKERLATETVRAICDNLPHPPSIIRYYDDFTEEYQAIRKFSSLSKVIFYSDGVKQTVNLSFFGVAEPILRLVLADWLLTNDQHTASVSFKFLQNFVANHGLSSLMVLIASSVEEIDAYWHSFVLVQAMQNALALRKLLHALCANSIGSWTPADSAQISKLRGPKQDKTRTVRIGDCFLPIKAQTAIIKHLDDICADILASPDNVRTEDIWSASILILCFQYGFRPGQIARIDTADLRVHSGNRVHISLVIMKQRDKGKKLGKNAVRTIRVTRRIKQDWTALFIELQTRRVSSPEHPNHPASPGRRLFKLLPVQVGKIIKMSCQTIAGDSWTANDLRHTAAQRLADAGVASVVISEFLTHTHARTALQYYGASPLQSKIINDALAISPIYSVVAKIAKDRTIDLKELLKAPSDEQIGAVPHGIPIAGIGRCGIGQSSCTKNPVLSCYTCRRFMPVNDATIHEKVLSDLRQIVVDFTTSSRGNERSPAYVQLRSTLDTVRRLSDSLKIESPT